MAPPSITAFLKNLPPVEDVADLSDSEELPPVCPSRKTFTIAPMRNHPILKHLFEESDRLEDSRDSQLEDAHVENSSQHSLPSDYEFRDFHHPDENLSEHEDGAGAETGDGKADAGYSSWDETPDNNQEELTEGISRPKPTSQSPAIAGPSVERPTPPVDASLLKKILSPRPTESLRYGQPFNSQVSRRAKRPLTEVSGQNTKRAKTKLTRED
ncbi:uncharacterized protein MELLADRAFT_109226 [Melampsora larici-populina 98AG31]|uniref:Uncharacterized protein n=1 Tax=Melampsora larici-populina (strain 98AG31 / pathotype 3-4-7) TaxID=747676 RepID=F4RVS8_MELLP|nr:uncharacterized protein MELLADRAFT_109226 [Melampsora larici-populina 98AG31]EGG03531.1 hypothetical protein MELLADRAFT_109226 [Melampsora larici-populina 98AG31]